MLACLQAEQPDTRDWHARRELPPLPEGQKGADGAQQAQQQQQPSQQQQQQQQQQNSTSGRGQPSGGQRQSQPEWGASQQERAASPSVGPSRTGGPPAVSLKLIPAEPHMGSVLHLYTLSLRVCCAHLGCLGAVMTWRAAQLC